jgi:CubicO group peptidase (beta-lactamase class C family)
MTLRLAALTALFLAPAAPRAFEWVEMDRLITDSLPALGDSVVVMIKLNGNLIYHTSKGNLDSASIIGIASASKWISGAVILRLAEKNLLKLDDSLGKHLPAFTAHGKGDITIRQCFGMTSGLFGGPDFDMDSRLSLQQSVDSIAAATPIAFPPGTRFAYSGLGMQAVGRIAEVVTGKTWRQVAQEEVLGPCDMAATTYDDWGAVNPFIAGGVRTTARDYLRFLDMVMSNGLYLGRRVLSPASIQEMFKDQTLGVLHHFYPWPGSPATYPDGKPPGYGFGCWAMSTNAASGLEDEIASPGAFGAFPWADRCRNLYGVVFVHNGFEDGFRAHTVSLQIVDLVRKAAGGCVNAGMEKPIAAKSARRFRYYTSYPMPFFETREDGRGGRLVDGRLIYPGD